jgi:hypothetical protein
MRRTPLGVVIATVGCSRTVPSEPTHRAATSVLVDRTDVPALAMASDAAPSTELPDLPDVIATFSGRPPTYGVGFTRRSYSRGSATVTVTLARFEIDEMGYARWVRQSEDGYPQATLDVPPSAGNGFYECADNGSTACDLLIQLRSGFHLEIRRDATATRADVDAVASGLPLRVLAHGGDEPSTR